MSATKRRRDIKVSFCVSVPCSEKFNIVSNDHVRTLECDFHVFDQKVSFSANLVKKIGIMVMFTFSVFNWNYPFKANLVQIIFKIVNLSRNLVPRQKSMVKSKINMQKLVELFILFVLDRKHPFWANLVQKNQNSQFKLKFGAFTNSNMQNWMALFTFTVLDRKHSFWANLVQKNKIVSLSWNLVHRLIRIRRI